MLGVIAAVARNDLVAVVGQNKAKVGRRVGNRRQQNLAFCTAQRKLKIGRLDTRSNKLARHINIEGDNNLLGTLFIFQKL